jgi:hypothetical protein
MRPVEERPDGPHAIKRGAFSFVSQHVFVMHYPGVGFLFLQLVCTFTREKWANTFLYTTRSLDQDLRDRKSWFRNLFDI